MRCGIEDIERVSLILSDDSVYIPINGFPCPNNERKNIAQDVLNEKKAYVLMPNEFSVFIFLPHDTGLYNVHTAILPKGRGRLGIKAFKQAAQWMFKNTNCIKLFGIIPAFRKDVILFHKWVGVVYEGVLSKSCIKNGVLYDQVVMGLSKS